MSIASENSAPVQPEGLQQEKHPQAFLDRLRLSQNDLGNVGIEIEGTDSQHLVKERD